MSRLTFRSRHARRGKMLVLPTPLSPETRDLPGTIWYNDMVSAGFITEDAETIQRVARDRIAGFDRAMTKRFQYRDYNLFCGCKGNRRCVVCPYGNRSSRPVTGVVD